MKKLTLFLIFLFTTGCGTFVEFVRKDYTPAKQGVLRYRGETNDPEYKSKVNDMASQFCAPEKYNITKEYEAKDFSENRSGVGTGIGFGSRGSSIGFGFGTSTPSTVMYNFVEFSCKP